LQRDGQGCEEEVGQPVGSRRTAAIRKKRERKRNAPIRGGGKKRLKEVRGSGRGQKLKEEVKRREDIWGRRGAKTPSEGANTSSYGTLHRSILKYRLEGGGIGRKG